jgi:flagellar hook-associated protein 2
LPAAFDSRLHPQRLQVIYRHSAPAAGISLTSAAIPHWNSQLHAVNLSSIGLGLNNDGTLSVDSGKLGTALAGNFSGVQNFLQSTTNGFTSNLSSALSGLTSSGTGVLALDSMGISQSSRALSQQISDLQVALSTKQQNLVRVYAQVNVTLQQLPLLQSQISRQLGSF